MSIWQYREIGPHELVSNKPHDFSNFKYKNGKIVLSLCFHRSQLLLSPVGNTLICVAKIGLNTMPLNLHHFLWCHNLAV